jgi:lipid-A-disaccharide synthase
MSANAFHLQPLVALGYLGQACFFARFFVQWLASERARRSIVPRSFWWLSLLGAGLVSVYATHQGSRLLLFGYLVSAAIAARNLTLSGRPSRLDPRWAGALALVVAVTSLAIAFLVEKRAADTFAWVALGGLGQALWQARFPLQWWRSERAGYSHFPPLFWWLSLGGNAFLLVYALHLGDPVYVAGFVPGPLLQLRNLMLGRRSAPAA